VVEIFPVLCQPATATQPTDGALDNPTFGQNDEALGPIGTTDDFSGQVRHDVRKAVMEYRPRIGAVSKQLLEERELSEQCGQEHQATVAILNIGWRHQCMQQQTQCIDENVALLAFDQLAGIEPMSIDAGPPFSALFTLWLSTMQAVGLASDSSCSRHLT
jgi:hypothetical protein